MAHFAALDENGVVTAVLVVSNETINDLPFPESEAIGVQFLTELSGGHSNWRQTSYNANFRKNYAGIGYKYDVELDAFVPPQPYFSWILDQNTAQWVAPIPYPNDGKQYVWNDETKLWAETA